MAWLKIDDQYLLNPKVAAAGLEGRALHMASLIYCAGQLTDGFIPLTVLGILEGLAGVPNLQAAVATLVEVGLWDVAENGWWVHDYLDYNPTREAVTAKRAESKERMRQLRGLRSPDVRANKERTSPDVRPLPSPSPSPSPIPIPIPDPNPSSSPSPGDDDDETETIARIFCLWEDRFGRLTDIQRQEVAYRLDEHGASRLCEALDATIANNGRSIAYLDTVLANWGKGKPRSRASPANSHAEDDFDWQAYSDELAQAREDNDGPRDDSDEHGEPPS